MSQCVGVFLRWHMCNTKTLFNEMILSWFYTKNRIKREDANFCTCSCISFLMLPGLVPCQCGLVLGAVRPPLPTCMSKHDNHDLSLYHLSHTWARVTDGMDHSCHTGSLLLTARRCHCAASVCPVHVTALSWLRAALNHDCDLNELPKHYKSTFLSTLSSS